MEEIAAKKRLQRDGMNIAMIAYVLKYQKQLKVQLKLRLIVLINGLVTITVMIKITILNVKWMEVIVVKKTLLLDGIIIAVIAYVLKFQKLLKLLLNVLINGLVTITVMIKTTILNVILMEVIVVKKTLQMDGITTAKLVNVLIFKRQHKPLKDPIVYFHNGLVITTVTMKTIIQSAVLMVVIAVETMSTQSIALNVHVLNDFKLLILRNIFRTY